ncbi:endonuclease/exonuclease/phosphatase family protein [Sphingomonas sp. 2R-10]|uniref:endonuclease/exonuclease/phosphatase family protein n=1 Tax=Sphingomonas sp. 2R-10 TaxID=3045148 RepID=UPI000F792552|nr:endonuclease/exonuclease/phosphatase family protein [Sphingomonas sp. 2R-10]MDJ0277384.1 endonuclease/exonuclease/phosphatase family protein [Sphingomonas sp. 2R-10]
MIRWICTALALLAALPSAARDLRVMSFNVRYPNPQDGPDRWEARAPILIDTIRAADPDLIGTQELFRRQGDTIVRALPGWRWFGRDRRGRHADEHMGIFYRSDRLRLVRQGDFWLSDTPDRVGSSSWGIDLPRMVGWGEFARADGSRFVFFDTHFPHRDIDDDARTQAARVFLARMRAIAGTLPVVIAGDLNATPDSEAYRTFAAALTDAWERAPVKSGPALTFHDFTGTPDRRIDYVFVRGFTPVSARVATDQRGGRYPSDHFPVVVDLK